MNPLPIIIIAKGVLDFFYNETPSDFKCRISDWRQLKPGDVIGAHRKPIKGRSTYDHYGIYAGNFEVIHFSNGRDDSLSGNVSVRKDSFYRFKGEDEVFVLDFDSFNESIKNPSRLEKFRRLPGDTIRKISGRNYLMYSPEETLRRAEGKIGKNGFNGKKGWRLWRNCEHFALWCKTGVAESSQIRRPLRMKLPTAG